MDNVLMLLEMGMSTCDELLLGGFGFSIVDSDGGAVVRGRVPMTCWMSPMILMSSHFLFQGPCAFNLLHCS